MAGSVINIKPTPVSNTKLNGPLLFICSLITTILRMSRKGILTFFRPVSTSKNCAEDDRQKKDNMETNHKAFLDGI